MSLFFRGRVLYVDLENKDDLNKALKLDGANFKGNSLKIKKSKGKNFESKIFVLL